MCLTGVRATVLAAVTPAEEHAFAERVEQIRLHPLPCFALLRFHVPKVFRFHAFFQRPLDCFVPSAIAQPSAASVKATAAGLRRREHDRLDNAEPPRLVCPDCGHTCITSLTEPGGMARPPPPQPCRRFCSARPVCTFPHMCCCHVSSPLGHQPNALWVMRSGKALRPRSSAVQPLPPRSK